MISYRILFKNKEKITKEIGLILIDKGKPILPWYPDYDSEDQFINESMTAFAEDMYVDPAESTPDEVQQA